jgi:exodeoxyribonuclease-3
MLTVATWNVNSIRARLARVVPWLEARRPDVVCLQETKVEDKDFPYAALEAAGYRAAHHGQKTYNGVAILAREALGDVKLGLCDGGEDPQCRLIGASVRGVRILSAYFPNGEAVGSPKWEFKLAWLGRLERHLAANYAPGEKLALCGDYNIAPEARDVHDPAAWEESTLFHPAVREALARIAAFGLVDTYRLHHEEEGKYSWWDYRMLAFPKNRGLRIDHIFATRSLAALCTGAEIDREARKGKLPSDHAPVLATFNV